DKGDKGDQGEQGIQGLKGAGDWNLQNNGETKDVVQAGDSVNFIDGKNTKVVVANNDGTHSTIKVDVHTASIDSVPAGQEKAGSAISPVTNAQTALTNAQTALAKLPTTATPAERQAAQTAVTNAQQDLAVATAALVTADDVAKAINNSGFTLTTSASGTGKASGSSEELVNPGNTVTINAGDNIAITQNAGKLSITTTDDVSFNNVKVADTLTAETVTAQTVSANTVTTNNLTVNAQGTVNMGHNVVSNVAPGVISANSTDAVNGSQLFATNQYINNLRQHIDGVEQNLEAGLAGSRATAALPQVSTVGKSMLAFGLGSYRDQAAVAVGFSSRSDNGRITIKMNVDANTQKTIGAGVGLGYEF
ncbi:YadA-like family protein, partial [Moraxella sp.]|uniref:YadA family autotransporter adhesin n=1 Tax=Moraxella sp. TaxID=479 RepID=UPI0026DB3D62